MFGISTADNYFKAKGCDATTPAVKLKVKGKNTLLSLTNGGLPLKIHTPLAQAIKLQTIL